MISCFRLPVYSDCREAALVALTDAGLCSKVTPQVDEAFVISAAHTHRNFTDLSQKVLVEVWGEGGSEELVLPILIEGGGWDKRRFWHPPCFTAVCV